jgi:hypothetical protein
MYELQLLIIQELGSSSTVVVYAIWESLFELHNDVLDTEKCFNDYNIFDNEYGGRCQHHRISLA